MATIAGFGITIIIIGILFIAAWIYSIAHAIKNDFKNNNKLIWILILLVIPPLGSLLYIIIGQYQVISYISGEKKQYIGNESINYTERRKQALREDEFIKTCSSCGNEMKIKEKLSGDEKGKRFWVCSMFPNCKTYEPYREQTWF